MSLLKEKYVQHKPPSHTIVGLRYFCVGLHGNNTKPSHRLERLRKLFTVNHKQGCKIDIFS